MEERVSEMTMQRSFFGLFVIVFMASVSMVTYRTLSEVKTARNYKRLAACCESIDVGDLDVDVGSRTFKFSNFC